MFLYMIDKSLYIVWVSRGLNHVMDECKVVTKKTPGLVW